MVPRATLRQLSYFVAIAECGSFRRAAERLNLSQPSLTQQIQALEFAVGVRLLDRQHGAVELTAGGRVYIEDARRILTEVEKCGRKARLVGAGLSGQLRIGLTDDFTFSPLFPKIANFVEIYTELHVETHVGLSNRLVSRLSDGGIDLAIVNRPLLVGLAGFEALELSPSRILLVVKTDHGLARYDRISREMLGGLRLVLPPEDPGVPLSSQCQRLMEDLPQQPAICHRTSNAVLALQFVREGLDGALVSEYSVSVGEQGLVALPIDHPAAVLQHALLRSNDHRSESADLFVQHLFSDDGDPALQVSTR